jgi:hypothetical protein
MYSARSIARRAPFASIASVQRAAFSQSIARSAGKESKLRTSISHQHIAFLDNR